MMRRQNMLAAVLVALAFFGFGCAGAMNSMKALQAAASEDASIEVSLDRIEDIDEGMKQVEVLLFQVPVQKDSEWVGQLEKLDNAKAGAFQQTLKQSGAYSMPNRNIAKIKIYRMHNDEIIKTAQGQTAEHQSVFDALASIAGDKGSKVQEAYKNLVALKKEIGDMEVQKDTLDDQEGQDAAIAELEKKIEEKEAAVEPAEEALFKEVENLGAVKLSEDNLDLAKALFKVMQHVANMELEAATTAAIVVVQVPLAVPNIPTEMTNMVQRWVKDMVTEITGTVGDVSKIKPELDFSNGVSVKLAGVEDAALADLPNRLTEKVTKFYDQATSAPGHAVSIAGQAEFQAKFLVALAKALGNMVGATFTEGPSFSL